MFSNQRPSKPEDSLGAGNSSGAPVPGSSQDDQSRPASDTGKLDPKVRQVGPILNGGTDNLAKNPPTEEAGKLDRKIWPMSSNPSGGTDKLEKVPSAEDTGVALSLTCITCGTVNRPGELTCKTCGTMLVQAGKTDVLPPEETPMKRTDQPPGDVIVTEQEPITFDIEGRELLLPSLETFTVGRSSDIPGDAPPDVDLGPFGAGDKGVSRKHIKIKRKNILVYVADLGSTNGTFLNGRKLIANAERLLRNGDEIQLGRLKIKVRF